MKDSVARGFEKLYSIVIVMKDKMFLLNTQPFLSNNIKDIARQIQESAQKIYEAEQKQFPQRAERLNTGKASNVPPRSLKELTGESNIFAHLHSMFSWVLWAGSRYYTEILTLGTPSTPALYKDIEEGYAFVQVDKEEFLMQNFPSNSNDVLAIHDSSYNLRALKSVAASNFNHILYCSLVGIQIVIRGEVTSMKQRLTVNKLFRISRCAMSSASILRTSCQQLFIASWSSRVNIFLQAKQRFFVFRLMLNFLIIIFAESK